MPLSSRAFDQAWRRHTVTRFSCTGFVSVSSATPCFLSARIAIADIAIAATHAAVKPGAPNADKPTDAIKRVRKGSSTIETANVDTGSDAIKSKPA